MVFSTKIQKVFELVGAFVPTPLQREGCVSLGTNVGLLLWSKLDYTRAVSLFWILLSFAEVCVRGQTVFICIPSSNQLISLFRAVLMNDLRYWGESEHINMIYSDFEVYCWFPLKVQALVHTCILVTERSVFFPPLIAVATCQWSSFEKIWLLWENGGCSASTNNSGPCSVRPQFKSCWGGDLQALLH